MPFTFNEKELCAITVEFHRGFSFSDRERDSRSKEDLLLPSPQQPVLTPFQTIFPTEYAKPTRIIWSASASSVICFSTHIMKSAKSVRLENWQLRQISLLPFFF